MDEDYLIEELDSNEVPASELVQFKEVEVVDMEKSSTSGVEVEGALIKKFVRGEVELPDLYTKLEPEEEEELEENEGDDEERRKPSAFAVAKAEAVELEQQDTEMPESGRQQRSRAGIWGTSTFRRRTVLSSALQGLMGEANLSYARGQIEIAEKICLEIIRQNPLAPEPFFTLAEIYETRDTEKSLNFLTIAAHLNPHDRDLWIRIAEMHIAKGNYQQARIYYTKAIKVLPKDYDMRLRKARVLEHLGEKHTAKFTYLKMIPYVPLEHADLCLDTARCVARHFHGLAKPILALQAMESAYNVCGKLFSLEDLNLYMELLIQNKAYAKVLSCLRERTNLELETEQEHNLELIFFCVIPDDFVPDFRSKLCVSLIHLRAHHLLGYLIQNVHEHIPVVQERLDLYIDIAEALMQEGKYGEAIELLRPITDDGVGKSEGDEQPSECPAFVWLRHAECLRHVNRTNEAIESYARVVELAPFCYEAKFTLSSLLKQQGRHLEAVKALEQSGEDGEGQPLNARLLYERCVMLQQIGEIDEFLEVGYMLLGRQSIKLRNREEMLAAANGGSFYNAEGLKVILQMRNIADDTDKGLQEYTRPPAEQSDLTIHDEYTLFLELVRTASKHGRSSYIERLCFAMVTTKRFVGYHIDLERIIIMACYFNDDCSIAFSYLRELISKSPGNTALWNLLSLLVQKGQDLRYHRYVRRLVERHPGAAHQMRVFLAHYHLHCSSFKYALNIYAPMFKAQQQPLLALCIAVVFNQLALQKKVLRKTGALAQAIAFVHKYADLRAGRAWTLAPAQSETSSSTLTAECEAEQEICYNIGRIYQQCGIMHLAVAYYEKGLAATCPLIEAHADTLELRHEIAYNLHLIYRGSGNLHKARHYLYKYCVV